MNDEIKPRIFYDKEWQKVLMDIDINKYSAHIDRIVPNQREIKVVYKLPTVLNPGKSIESSHIICTLFPPEDEKHGITNHLSHIADIYAEHDKDSQRLLEIQAQRAPNNED